MITIDDTFWPLLTVQFLGRVTQEQLEGYLASRVPYLHRPEPHVALLDVHKVDVVATLQMRRSYEAWSEANQKLLEQKVLGSAYVLASPVLRLLLSSIVYFKRSLNPYIVVSKPAEAVPWACERLKVAGFEEAARRVEAHYARGGG